MFGDHVAVGGRDLEWAVRHVDVDVSSQMTLELLLILLILHAGHEFAHTRKFEQLRNRFSGVLFPDSMLSNAIGDVLLLQAPGRSEASAMVLSNGGPVVDLMRSA